MPKGERAGKKHAVIVNSKCGKRKKKCKSGQILTESSIGSENLVPPDSGDGPSTSFSETPTTTKPSASKHKLAYFKPKSESDQFDPKIMKHADEEGDEEDLPDRDLPDQHHCGNMIVDLQTFQSLLIQSDIKCPRCEVPESVIESFQYSK